MLDGAGAYIRILVHVAKGGRLLTSRLLILFLIPVFLGQEFCDQKRLSSRSKDELSL